MDSFPPEVVQALGHYVYRLIDPRNGETFYVGKGQGTGYSLMQRALIDDGT